MGTDLWDFFLIVKEQMLPLLGRGRCHLLRPWFNDNQFSSLTCLCCAINLCYLIFCRYCLWIFGNEATLRGSRSVWRNLINDAKNRRCYYNAQDDHRLAKTIVATLVDIDRFEVSLSIDSLLFQEAKWKV